MTELKFKPDFKSSELQDLDVPVEVFTKDMKTVARTTSSQPVKVDEGEAYYAVARLPSGHELIGYVEAEGESATVALEAEPGDESPEESMEQTHFLTQPEQTGTSPESADSELETLGPEGPPVGQVTLRRITGNPYRGELEIEDETDLEPTEGGTTYGAAGPGVALVQILQEGFAPITISTPAAVGPSTTTLTWVRQPAGNWSFDVHLGNSVANLLVHYRAHGFARQAAETLESPNLNAEELLRGKMADPIGAAVGAYALLRFADLDRLHDWTANLYERFPDFADAAAIRGEHLARHGEHEQALEIFLTLEERGLPAFLDGFSYTLDRLRLYLESGEFGDAAKKRCDDVLDLLKRLAPIVDFGKPLLTFTADPIELLRPSGGPS